MEQNGQVFRVGISGSYGGLNLGDGAILEAIMTGLRRSIPVEITVFSRDCMAFAPIDALVARGTCGDTPPRVRRAAPSHRREAFRRNDLSRSRISMDGSQSSDASRRHTSEWAHARTQDGDAHVVS